VLRTSCSGLGNTSHASPDRNELSEGKAILYRGCHALCTSDASFVLPIAIGITHSTRFTSCACTAYGRPIFFCGGQKEAGHACCSCSLYASQAPPANPRTPARARLNSPVYTLWCACQRVLVLPKHALQRHHNLSAPCLMLPRLRYSSWACIIFLKAKCRAKPTHIRSTCPSKKRDEALVIVSFFK